MRRTVVFLYAFHLLVAADGIALVPLIPTYTTRFAKHHHVTASSPHALTHGFVVAFYVLAAISIAGSLLSAVLIESQPAEAEEETPIGDLQLVEEAA